MNMQHLMFSIASLLGANKWTLRSGHADGADQAFENGCIASEGTKEIYLPWDSFNGKSSKNHGYQAVDCLDNFLEAEEITAKFHPAWDKCSPGAKKLHIRNVYQIAGMDLTTPTNMVICWTEGGLRRGGTGQALRIAEYLDIPIFDLALKESLNNLNEFVNK